MYDFTRGIPIERFEETEVEIQTLDFDKPLVGSCRIDLENNQVLIRGKFDQALWVFEFEEITNLRFVPSGLVHDYYWEERGDMIHVPQKGEWTTYGFNKIL